MYNPQTRSKVTATSGTVFAISEPNGNIKPGTVDGFYSLDTRFLSTLNLYVDGREPQAVGVDQFEYYVASFYTTANGPAAKSPAALSVVRDRMIGTGLHEDVYMINHAAGDQSVRLEFEADADFADVFEVRRGQFRKLRSARVEPREGQELAFVYDSGKFHGETWISFSKETVVEGKRAAFQIELRPRAIWKTCIRVLPVAHDPPLPMRCVESVLGSPFASYRRRRRKLRREPRTTPKGPLDGTLPVLKTDNADLAEVYKRSILDLRALQMNVLPNRFILTAGLPWFMALFGRDSIISAIQTKLLGQDLMIDTLHTLAHFQADAVDTFREAEPGKIPHEIRHGELSIEEKVPHSRYYGSIDATPLFVILLSEAFRWTGKTKLLGLFLGAAESALKWVDEYGDLDGDGFIEYRGKTKEGLRNKGWKDSDDSIAFENGQLAEPPIALSEVQGYVFDAKSRVAELYRIKGNEDGARQLEAEAKQLQDRFNKAFWMPEKGYFAVALDGEKNRVDSITSNPGHCLWSGIVDEQKALGVARRLLADDMFTGWGVRTLSNAMARYDPLSYHNGAVWPHDNSIIASGMARYGLIEEANKLVSALLDAAMAFPEHRLPELFSGYTRRELSSPVPYPAANAPQAWASGAVIYSLETLLGITPRGSHLLLKARLGGPVASIRGVPYKGLRWVV
jgi:glycogen debranching enzyme